MSIFNVVDELRIQQFPTALAKITLLFGLEREREDPQTFDGVIIVTRGEIEITRWPASGDFGERPRLRLIPIIQGLVIPAPGTYKIGLNVNNREVAFLDFPVIQLEAAQPALTFQ
jgi:hypothetical protein